PCCSPPCPLKLARPFTAAGRAAASGAGLPRPIDMSLHGSDSRLGEQQTAAMLDHVSITVSDLARAARFYDAVMAALGQPCIYRADYGIGYGVRSRPDDDDHSYISVFRGDTVVTDRRHYAFR